MRVKLLAGFLLVSLVPLAAFSYQAATKQEGDLVDDACDQMKALAATQEAYIESNLRLDELTLRDLGNDLLLRARLRSAITEGPGAAEVARHSLSRNIEEYDRLVAATMVTANGTVAFRTEAATFGVNRFVEDGGVKFGAVIKGANGHPVMLSSFPVSDVDAHVVLEHDLTYLVGMATDYRGLGETGEVSVAQATPDGAQLIVPLRFDDAPMLDVTVPWKNTDAPIVKAFEGLDEPFPEAIDYRSEPVIGATRLIERTDWAIVTKIDRSEALGLLSDLRNGLMVAASIAAVIAGLVAILLSGRINARLRRVTKAVGWVTAGDLSRRVETTSDDEIGQLSVAFNSMADQLSHAREQAEQRESELRVVNERLEASEQRVRAVFDATADGIVHVDERGHVVDLNDAAEHLFGVSAALLIGTPLYDRLVSPQAVGLFDSDLYERVAVDEPRGVDATIEAPDGSRLPVNLKVAPLVTDAGRGYAMLVRNMSERVELERKVAQLATHDPLTQLANRRLIVDLLGQALANRAPSREVAVLFCDLDRFKLVNDSLGHAAGDLLLKEVARRLVDVVGDRTRIARFGGDEFIIVIPDVAETREAEQAAEQMIDRVSGPISVDGDEVFVTASIGIAVSSWEQSCGEDLIANADMAMYKAKQEGRDRVLVYDGGLRHAFTERHALGNALKPALEDGEVELHYQPIVITESGELWGAEALARWNMPGVGMVSPSNFIPVAEETGLIVPLGRQLFEQACVQMATWQNAGGSSPQRVTFNLSARELMEPELVASYAEIIERSGVDPSAIVVELTESMLVQDADTAIERLWGLKSLGLLLALDDFGTGYSSLTYLRQLPLDLVKIDRSFVAQLASIAPAAGESIVSMVVGLSSSLGLSVVAEGVESARQLDMLRSMRCELAQGWYFGAAQPAAELERQFGGVLEPSVLH